MSGDSDNEFESVGETPAPPPAEPKAEEPERAPRRAFRAWESAQKEEGALSKLGKRISGIFAKRPSQQTTPIDEPAATSDLELIMPDEEPAQVSAVEAEDVTADVTPVESAAETPAEPQIDPAFYVPPEVAEQLGAPQQPLEEPAVEQPMAFDVVPESEPIEASDVIPAIEDVAEVVEAPKRPGLFSRLFGRKSKAEPAPVEPALAEPEPVEATPAEIESFAVEKDEVADLQPSAPDEEPLIAAAEHPDAQLEETLEPMVMESAPAQPAAEAEPMFVEPATEPMDVPPVLEEPPTEPMPERRGLFGRLFSRKPKVSRPVPIEEPDVAEQPDVVEQPEVIESTIEEIPALESAEAPVVDEELVRTDEHAIVPDELSVEPMAAAPIQEEAPVFASVDDALPAEPQPSTVDLIEAALSEPIVEEEKKPGFFGRLFGRKSKSEPRPSLEIEFHEDRVEAAAHALDDVSGESFAGATAEATDPYASVEDALPTPDTRPPTEESTLEVPAITPEDLRFAPPPAPAVQEPVASDARSTLEIEPFDPFAQTLDPNDQVGAPPSDSRSTLEVPQDDKLSDEELALEAELGLRPSADETERKTDEFEIPSVDTEATTGEIIEPAGAQAAKLTWWMRLLGRKPKVDAKAGLAVGGTVVEGKPDFLFSKFKAFYGEIIRFKHQKTEFAAGFSTQMLTDFNADLSPDAAASAQSQALQQMLELQAAEAQWMGGEAKDRYPDAQYAMACMADELFTHMEWDGQAAWRNHLLEVKLFKSHAADVELFKRIDKLLKESPNSHVARDLARVYLLVLAAGFQGKYRPFGLPRALAQYRQRLYEYIHEGDSLMLYAPDRKIFPDAASRTLEGHAVGRFSSLQRWAAILVFLVLGYTVLAHYAWNRVSADLKDVTERIRAASSTSGASTSPTSSTSAAAANGGGR